MQHATNLPFELGEVIKGTDTDGNIMVPEWAGKVHLLADSNVSSARLAPRRLGRQLIGIPVLNNSGITLLGKRFARLKRSGGKEDLMRVDGYAAATAEKGLVFIDEYLSTVGVADKYYFWGIVGGMVTGLTPTAGADFGGADIAISDDLVSATAATSQTSSAGRVGQPSFTAATAGNTAAGFDGYRMALRSVARALSARTTGETNADILLHLMIRY